MTAQERAETSRRGMAAAVGLARELGLTVAEPVVLADLFSLMVHLSPAPVVARVATRMSTLRTPIEKWLGYEVDVTRFLTAKGAPVVGPSAELPAGPHHYGGFGISFWTYVEPDRDRTPTAADSAAMLGDLHAVLRAYPGELPPFCANDIARGLALLDGRSPVLAAADVALLKDSAHRLAAFMAEPGGEVQALHGDAHAGNLIATREGLLWIDFEDVCRGPVEWDLASMMDADAVRPRLGTDPERLARCVELRTLQVALALTTFHREFGDMEGWEGGIRDMVDKLRCGS